MTDYSQKISEMFVDGRKAIMCASCESVEIDPERDYRHECKSCR